MASANGRAVPISPGVQLVSSDAEGQEPLCAQEAGRYREIVGNLMYLAVCTRPDLAYPVSLLSRTTASRARSIWRYRRACCATWRVPWSRGWCLVVVRGESFVGYTDADFAGDVGTRKSTSAYVFLCNGGAVSWKSVLQCTVPLSTLEAEYVAAGGAVCEGLWLRKLMGDWAWRRALSRCR